ncbi:hypothetical protein PF005_g504 [Phytophthora fragariae]|uniref:RxLR effector protein n=1 Tax=Phytophthora fragariae TaxID=53985 RepID=A0A6A3FZV5_9STRA|nr:hypothetical protein PF003_g9989 [Phytophthora fragariae]KAE8949966.1 hypothetical protein PF009_g510 [Phytophthora fragariae]KAE9029063.1 hypothetical protein PF011_g1247 [Phytophthora fragariae]KAE9139765.1 hypothetical protein PF010_g462 [Phytophthora fragariae]KAE9140804.1 hypothetical protein PF007_g513 [Phytophthora fragariae]
MAALLVVLLGASTYGSTLPVDVATGDAAFQIAAAFESVPDENTTELLDEVVMPASLETERAVPPPPAEDSEPRDLRPFDESTEKHHTSTSSLPVPYGGAFVAVEATALLVGGAAIVVLLIAKVKARSAVIQYEYDEDIDPMLQSLLYSDMDYAAI